MVSQKQPLTSMSFLALGTRSHVLKSHNLWQIFSEYLPTYNIFKSLDYAYPKDVKDFIITLSYFILFHFISFYFIVIGSFMDMGAIPGKIMIRRVLSRKV